MNSLDKHNSDSPLYLLTRPVYKLPIKESARDVVYFDLGETIKIEKTIEKTLPLIQNAIQRLSHQSFEIPEHKKIDDKNIIYIPSSLQPNFSRFIDKYLSTYETKENNGEFFDLDRKLKYEIYEIDYLKTIKVGDELFAVSNDEEPNYLKFNLGKLQFEGISEEIYDDKNPFKIDQDVGSLVDMEIIQGDNNSEIYIFDTKPKLKIKNVKKYYNLGDRHFFLIDDDSGKRWEFYQENGENIKEWSQICSYKYGEDEYHASDRMIGEFLIINYKKIESESIGGAFVELVKNGEGINNALIIDTKNGALIDNITNIKGGMNPHMKMYDDDGVLQRIYYSSKLTKKYPFRLQLIRDIDEYHTLNKMGSFVEIQNITKEYLKKNINNYMNGFEKLETLMHDLAIELKSKNNLVTLEKTLGHYLNMMNAYDNILGHWNSFKRIRKVFQNKPIPKYNLDTIKYFLEDSAQYLESCYTIRRNNVDEFEGLLDSLKKVYPNLKDQINDVNKFIESRDDII